MRVPRQPRQLQFNLKLGLKCVLCWIHLLEKSNDLWNLPSWNWLEAPWGAIAIILGATETWGCWQMAEGGGAGEFALAASVIF